ncbi:MAG: IS200/IS605 family transposase [Bacteroidota bacterium]|nr:IS200/IS605 family transposase [Bacteroidota bacterium]
MAQSLSQLYTHVVFSTKKHFPFIKSEIEAELYAYIGGTIKKIGGIPFMINGMDDHIHIFSTLPRTVALSKLVEDIKRNSSRWIKTKGGAYRNFAWQNGYAGFSVSSSKKDTIVRYIANQKEHHKVVSYKEEVLKFLQENNINYDERYLWD